RAAFIELHAAAADIGGLDHNVARKLPLHVEVPVLRIGSLVVSRQFDADRRPNACQQAERASGYLDKAVWKRIPQVGAGREPVDTSGVTGVGAIPHVAQGAFRRPQRRTIEYAVTAAQNGLLVQLIGESET